MTSDRRRRLLLLTNSVQVGGMEEHVRLITEELSGDEFDISVVFPDWDETNWFAKRMESAADRLTFITPDRRPGSPGPLREARRLAVFARRQRIDVAHLHSTTFEGLLLAMLAIRAAGVSRVLVTEHLAPERPVPLLDRLRRRLVERLASGIISVSDRNRQARLQFLGGSAERIHTVNNGINVAALTEPIPEATLEGLRLQYQIPADAEIVGTVIRLEPGKNVDDLVEAFAILRRQRQRAHLLIVGDGSLRPEIEEQCRQRGLTEHVTLTGFASDPRPYIALTDVFVLPVPYGSASIVLLEAMAMSKVCVISFGGEGEAVVPGESGFWAEPRNPQSIATHVEKLLDDPVLRADMERAARQRVETSFSSTQMAAELAELYRHPDRAS